MRLYVGSTTQFVEDNFQNQIAGKLEQSFFDQFRYKPSPSEVNSWRNSLKSMSAVIEHADLSDNGIILEYQLPQTSKRLDVMLTGSSDTSEHSAVIVELKQWGKTQPAHGPNEIATYVGGAVREVLHPSVQVGQYHQYLVDSHSAFYDGSSPVALSSCAYLHNYRLEVDDPLNDDKFTKVRSKYPLFPSEDVNSLVEYLKGHVGKGRGTETLQRVEESEFRPSKKLMQHVANVIRGKSEYVLLDEQLIVYDKVYTLAQKSYHDAKKHAIIIKGGPGTGKSVIAINLMADLLEREINAHYVTGSKAFTETLRTAIGQRGGPQFKYFNSYTNADYNSVDVMIADEAHRIRVNSWSRFTPKAKRTDRSQVNELLETAKVSVFFLDDDQVVRPNEIGSTEYIKKSAHELDCEVHEYELEAQFRCSGSEAFVNWINNTLGIKKTANILWNGQEEFDFQIVDNPHLLEEKIRSKVEKGFTGRVAAGFCWAWSKQPNPDGTLKLDVVVGDYVRPWDAHYEARGLAQGIPSAALWAYDPNGIDQIGCVYNAQGFEFDYVGVCGVRPIRFI